MILATNVVLPIGKIIYINKMTDSHGKLIDKTVPCLILREVTREEYKKEHLDNWPSKELYITDGYNAKYFYEFHTD